MNKALNNNVKLRKGKKLDKYICKDCNVAYYGYDYALCPYCDSLNSGEKTDILYIFSDCFSYANGKPEQMAGFCTIITNDRFDLEDTYNIEKVIRKAFKGQTNNFGELSGVLAGLDYFINEEIYEPYKKLVVISDSEYVILGARDRMEKWKKNGWKNTSGEVKNKDLWICMDNYVNFIKSQGVDIEFIHQKGHSGKSITKEEDHLIYMQEKCDTLAVEVKNKILNK